MPCQMGEITEDGCGFIEVTVIWRCLVLSYSEYSAHFEWEM